MPQVTGNLTINDGSATPVAKTFAVERVSPEVSSFVERSSGVSAGFIRLVAFFSAATAKRLTNRIRYTVAIPVLETVNGISTVAYVLRSDCSYIIPEQATAQNRADLQAYTVNGMNLALLKANVKDLDPNY